MPVDDCAGARGDALEAVFHALQLCAALFDVVLGWLDLAASLLHVEVCFGSELCDCVTVVCSEVEVVSRVEVLVDVGAVVSPSIDDIAPLAAVKVPIGLWWSFLDSLPPLRGFPTIYVIVVMATIGVNDFEYFLSHRLG